MCRENNRVENRRFATLNYNMPAKIRNNLTYICAHCLGTALQSHKHGTIEELFGIGVFCAVLAEVKNRNQE
jgi:hypothetical protein